MDALIVAISILLSVILVSVNYLSGLLATPPNAVYLGTVHWPGDYFYYLSQFAQGRYSWFYSYDLYTGDFPFKTLVGWVNVFLGRIFFLVGIDQFKAYQLCVIIFLSIFLLLSFLLIKEIFPGKLLENRWKRPIAFILFVFSNAFPKIIYEGGKITFSYYDYWFNNGVFFNRLVAVPHQLIARGCISLILLLAIVWWNGHIKQKILIWLFGFAVVGFVLASTEPVQWAIVLVVLFIGSFIYPRFTPFRFIPFIFFLIGGVSIAVYMKQLFLVPPYSQLRAWEVIQSLSLSLINFILANGPVMVLAIIGIFHFTKKSTVSKNTAIIFTLVTIVLFLSPIPRLLGIVNVRFLPAITTVFLACIATEGIWSISQRAANKSYVLLSIIVFLILVLNAVPLFIQLKLKTKTNTSNSFFYVDKKVFEIFNKAKEVSSFGDLFLVVWPYNLSFPAATSRHTYTGHHLLTIDSNRKEMGSYGFFYEGMNPDEMEQFLVISNIKYVIAYSWTERISSLPVLDKQYDNGLLVLYKVNRK